MGSSTFPGASTTFAEVSPLTARGGLIIGTAGTPTGTQVAVGAENQVLKVDSSGDSVWAAAAAGGFSEFMLAYVDSSVTCNNTTMTPLSCSVTVLDSDDMHDSGGSAAVQAQIKFTTAGTYRIVCHARTASANAEWALYLLSGAGPVWLYRNTTHITNTEQHDAEINTYLTQTAGSYVSMQMWQNSGGSALVQGKSGDGPETYMAAWRVG